MRFNLNTELSLKNDCYTQFFKILLFVLRRKFSFHFVSFLCRFFKLETSLNFCTFISKIFLKFIHSFIYFAVRFYTVCYNR